MSASSVHSLASTQEDDVASIELGVSTAASYCTEDEGALLHWAGSPITPPLAYEDDDVSEKTAASPHSSLHHDDDTMEVARRDTPRLSIGEEFTARVHELLLHESKATIKAERALAYERDEKSARVDSEEDGCQTALEIGSTAPVAPTTRRPLPATPRRPQDRDASTASGAARGANGGPPLPARFAPQPPTPRPPPVRGAGMRLPGLAGLAPPPPPPPFFAGGPPHHFHHRAMYNGFGGHPGGPFGPLGFGGPSMRPFNSLAPPGMGPLPPHLSAGGLGRPLHLGGGPHLPPLPPRAYMGGGPPASLGAGRRQFPGAAPHHAAHHHHPAPPPHHHAPHHHINYSPPSSIAMGADRRTMGTPKTDSESSPRGAFSAVSAVSTMSSPRTANSSSCSPYYGRMSQSIGSSGGSGGRDHRDHSSSQQPSPTMASLGIGAAAASAAAMMMGVGGASVCAASAAAAELTPYPLVYVSPAGSISCVLNHDVVVEMAVDRSVRIVLHDNFAAFCNARGTSSAILHPTARILHTEEYVYTKFIANNEKMAVFGEQGVLFTMSHLSEAYLVNSAAYPGASAVALDQLQFPAMDEDHTLKMFYTEAQTGQQFIALCKDIVSEATYDRRPDGSLYLHINGMLIRQSTSGDVIIDARPRQISCSPSKKSVHVRSGCIDMAVEEDERGYVKRAHKRVHVSRSGMVISDGNCITSMDHFGRIVCCN